jgi:hypothetical protein
MESGRVFFVSASLLVSSAVPAMAQTGTQTPPPDSSLPPPMFAPPQGIRPTDKANQGFFGPQPLPNQFMATANWSPFGTQQDRTFWTPVGPPGAVANVYNQPSTGFVLQQQLLQQQRPGFWQRVRVLLGLGQDPTPQPGTIPQQQLPPGSIDPKVFGGR